MALLQLADDKIINSENKKTLYLIHALYNFRKAVGDFQKDTHWAFVNLAIAYLRAERIGCYPEDKQGYLRDMLKKYKDDKEYGYSGDKRLDYTLIDDLISLFEKEGSEQKDPLYKLINALQNLEVVGRELSDNEQNYNYTVGLILTHLGFEPPPILFISLSKPSPSH